MSQGPLRRVAVALDTADWETYRAWCRLFGARVGVLKVGLEAYALWGRRAVDEALAAGGRVFLDVKLHDIPRTVSRAAAAHARLGVDLLTVHASGGPEMLAAAAEGAAGQLRLLAVTLLTHLDTPALRRLGLDGAPEERVLGWALMAREAGCAGAVCSPAELGALRPALPAPFLLVTPGIRLRPVAGDDQRRTADPASALAAGSDLLVVGRPLTAAEDPGAALDELETALGAPAATR